MTKKGWLSRLFGKEGVSAPIQSAQPPADFENKCSFCQTPERQCSRLFSNGIGKFLCGDCVVKFKRQLSVASDA